MFWLKNCEGFKFIYAWEPVFFRTITKVDSFNMCVVALSYSLGYTYIPWNFSSYFTNAQRKEFLA